MFCGAFDERLAAVGPPSIFLPDKDGLLRFDADWTRDAWNHAEAARLDPGVPGPWGWVLLRDHATGFVTLVLATGPNLLRVHPRGSPTTFPTADEARAARAGYGSPPVGRRGP